MKDKGKFHTVRGYELLNQEKKMLTSAMEDYLEMIYRNISEDGYLRVNTLAQLLNVQASSATKMVQKLAHMGLLEYQRYGIILLTGKGRDIGNFLLNRHRIIEAFLMLLGTNDNLLVETELIEHNISKETLNKIELLNRFFEQNPDVMQRFEEYKKP